MNDREFKIGQIYKDSSKDGAVMLVLFDGPRTEDAVSCIVFYRSRIHRAWVFPDQLERVA